jgi:hypothetical protein
MGSVEEDDEEHDEVDDLGDEVTPNESRRARLVIEVDFLVVDEMLSSKSDDAER